ncbi:unnamed protein product, partial [Closterium sp. NIES-54]
SYCPLFLATVVTDPDFESTAAFSVVTELGEFAARSRLDYVASLVTESESLCPPSVGGELALSSNVLENRKFELQCLETALPRFASMLLCPEGDPDALDIPTPRSYAEAIAGEYSSQWQTAMDVEMASWKSTGTYADVVPPPRANIVDDMWFFRVKHPPGSPTAFKARYVARGFTQFDYELHSLDFSTTFLKGRIHEEIWLHHPLAFHWVVFSGYPVEPPMASLRSPPGTPRVARHTEDDTCGSWGVDFFQTLSPTPKMTTLRVLLQVAAQFDYELHSLNFSTTFLKGRIHEEIWLHHPLAFHWVVFSGTSGMGLVLGGRGSAVLTGHSDASSADDQATQRSLQGYTFSLGSGFFLWRSTRSSSVIGSSCEAEIYAGAMAAQEQHWLTYLLTDLGERPRSPPVLYVDNKAMLALCH